MGTDKGYGPLSQIHTHTTYEYKGGYTNEYGEQYLQVIHLGTKVGGEGNKTGQVKMYCNHQTICVHLPHTCPIVYVSVQSILQLLRASYLSLALSRL